MPTFSMPMSCEPVRGPIWVVSGGRRAIVGYHKIGYESVYLYLALCFFTGKGFAAFLPKLNGAFFEWFVEQIDGDLAGPTLFMADGAKAHKSECFEDTHMVFSKLPPAYPELNRVERVFLEVRRDLKHRVFSCLQEAQGCVKRVLEELFCEVGTIVGLSCFPYITATLPTLKKATL